MNVLVIDAQGGGIGKQLIAEIKKEISGVHITAIGTNGVATAAMLKAGADEAATGENSVLVCCRNADVIIGPVGIVVADSMLGEVTPKMALAVAQSNAKRILIPFNNCNTLVVGASQMKVGDLISEGVEKLKQISMSQNMRNA